MARKLAIILLLLLLLLALPCGAATITVGPSGCDYTALDTAVGAAGAGDTVDIMAAGNYTLTENVNGKSGLTVRKNPGVSGTVNVTADGAGTSVLYAADGTTNNITLEGIAYSGGTTKGRLFYVTAAASGWTLRDCTVSAIGGSAALYMDAPVTNLTVDRCRFTGGASVAAMISCLKGGSVTVVDSDFYGDNPGNGGQFLNCNTSAVSGVSLAVTLARSRFFGADSSTSAISFRNQGGGALTAALTATACFFGEYENGTTYYIPKPIYLYDYGTTATFNHCVFRNYNAFGIVATNGTGGGADLTIALNNCIGIGFGLADVGGRNLWSVTNSPVLTLNRCFYIPYGPGSISTTGATLTNCLLRTEYDDMNPRLAAYAKPHGYILLTMDDVEDNTAYQRAVVDVWKAKGVKGTLFVNPSLEGYEGVDLSGDADFQALVGAGYDSAREWGVHSWSHAGLTNTVAWTIKMKTADTATLTITETAFTLDCSNDSGDVTFDLTTEAYDSPYQVYLRLTQAPYSTYYTVASFFDGTGTRSQSSSLADVTAEAVPASGATAYDILLDTGPPNYRYYRDEIQDTKAWLVANTGKPASQITTMAAPGSKTNAALVAYLKATESDPDVGIVFNRGLADTGYTIAGSQMNLRNINMLVFGLCSSSVAFGPGNGGERTEAEVKAYAKALAVFCLTTGWSCAVYSHGYNDEGANLITPEEWGWFIEAVQEVKPSMLKSASEFAAIIRESGTWTRDITNTEVWNAVFVDQADWRPLAGSCLIDAGVTVAGADTDFFGRSQAAHGFAPDIGAVLHPFFSAGIAE